MPRFPLSDPKAGPSKAIFEGPLKGKELNIFRSMGNSPAALEVYLGMSGALNKSSLSLKEREVIQLAVAEANNCEYCLAAHTAIGTQAGLSQDQTIEARRGKMKDARLDALAKFVLTLQEKRGFVADADLKAFRSAGFSDANAVDAIATYALAYYTNIFNHANETPVDFPAPPTI